MDQPRGLIVREWPADWPGTRAAVERAHQLGQLVDARRTVRAGREVVQVVLRGQAVQPAPSRRPLPGRQVVMVGAGGAGAVGAGVLLWLGGEWAMAASAGARAAVADVVAEAVSWLVVLALCVAAAGALVRSIRD